MSTPSGYTGGIDVLFGQAYYLRFDPKLWAARQPYAPLGTLYAAAYLRQRRYRVALFDAMLAESVADWGVALDRHRPRFAVIYEDSFNYLSKMCLRRMREAAFEMMAMARARGIPIIVAGSDATDHAAAYLDRGASFVVTGEGEQTLGELIDVLTSRSQARVDHVAGLAFRRPDGSLLCTPPREIIRDLDSLPFPAWDLIDTARYRDAWTTRHGYYSMNLVTTRGCPFHCNWCARPIYGQRYTSRSPENVVDEIVWLKSTFHPDHLWIADDIFGLRPGWIERFAAAVTSRGAVVPYKCLLRVDLVSERVVEALRLSGCRTVWVGAESGSQRVLDAMEKGTRVEQIYDATRLLQRAGIEVGFFLQFGYPGETVDDIERTRRMVRECRPDDIGISVSYPLPGTPFYERVRRDLGEKQNWEDSDDLDTMYRATYPPEFYRVLHRAVHAEFRWRKVRARGWSLGHGSAAPVSHRLRESLGALYHAARLPWLELRMERLTRAAQPGASVMDVSGLSPRAAAIPREQQQ